MKKGKMKKNEEKNNEVVVPDREDPWKHDAKQKKPDTEGHILTVWFQL